MAPLIEFRNVYKYFGGLCAINNVSLRVARGEVIGLVGDNAAGKSTLMKIISEYGDFRTQRRWPRIESA